MTKKPQLIIADYLSHNTDWTFQQSLDAGSFLWNRIKDECNITVNESNKITYKDLDIGMKVYHDTLYQGREQMVITGIRKHEVELEGDYSGGTHNVIQKDWLPIEGLRFEYNKEYKMF